MLFRVYTYCFFIILLSSCSPNKAQTNKEATTAASLTQLICQDLILANKTSISHTHLQHCEKIMSNTHFGSQTKWYVKDYKVKPVIAEYRIGIQEEIAKLDSQLSKNKGHFAGLYIQHKPDYSVNILLKNLPDTTSIQQIYADKSWTHFSKIHQVKYSLKELETIRVETENVFTQHKIRMLYVTNLDIKQNRVKLIVNDKNAFLSVLKHKKVKHSNAVLISEGIRIACTQIGCNNRITINLSKKLKTDDYLFKIKFDHGKTQFFKIKVSDKLSKECKTGKYLPIYAIKNFKPSSTLFVDAPVYRDKTIPYFKTRSVGSFSSFAVSHKPNSIEKTDDPVNMNIEIQNGMGKIILKQNRVIHFDKKTRRQPNGKQCEPICYKTIINL